ncbi:MAG: hypothetical protein HZB51_30410 [Chloroflexi bacterium]|nr:hypothetical protein [Chloroflexota bacterium]
MTNFPDSQLTISIADWIITLDLVHCDDPMRNRINKWYSAFVVSPSADAMTIDVKVEVGPEYIPFKGNKSWQIKTSTQNGRIEFESHLEKGWFDRQAKLGQVVLRPNGDLENYLRVLYAWFCVDHGSLLLHSCGIIRDGRGYVFFGPSGNGKTTTTSLSAPYTILSDDLVIIKKVENRFRVYGVPFRGDLPEAPRTNASAEVCGVFALTKDKRHYLTPLVLPEAVARLVQCVPFVMTQPEIVKRVTEICTDLAKSVPLQMLHFRKDNGFWEIIP